VLADEVKDDADGPAVTDEGRTDPRPSPPTGLEVSWKWRGDGAGMNADGVNDAVDGDGASDQLNVDAAELGRWWSDDEGVGWLVNFECTIFAMGVVRADEGDGALVAEAALKAGELLCGVTSFDGISAKIVARRANARKFGVPGIGNGVSENKVVTGMVLMAA
jgi:hypothetical protein